MRTNGRRVAISPVVSRARDKYLLVPRRPFFLIGEYDG